MQYQYDAAESASVSTFLPADGINPMRRFTTSVLVDLDQIASNVRSIRAHIGPDVEMLAVVKDDAYGHGATQVARVALDNGANRLAVGRTDEGILLRQAGFDAPILNLCWTIPAEAEDIVRYDLIPTVTTLQGAEALSHYAGQYDKTLPVHVKVDTGMRRYGLMPDELILFLEGVSRLPHLDLEGIFTHFATADSADKTFTNQQFSRFMDALNLAEKAGFQFELRHVCNSAATLDLPGMHLDAVRPGIILYGQMPSQAVTRPVTLSPALTLQSHIARVFDLDEGEGIGYGMTYHASSKTPAALVPVGYGDGYLRLLSNRGYVLIKGERAPIMGRVCMDQFMVSTAGIENVNVGDPVVLLGKQGGAEISADEIARLAETISYEIVTLISQRIPRIYIHNKTISNIGRIIPPQKSAY